MSPLFLRRWPFADATHRGSWGYGLCLVLTLLQSLPASAQLPDTATQLIRPRRTNSPVQLEGWRYHAGDNLAWSRPDFDASAWATVPQAPALYQRALPQATQAGVYWLRWRFRTSETACGSRRCCYSAGDWARWLSISMGGNWRLLAAGCGCGIWPLTR